MGTGGGVGARIGREGVRRVDWSFAGSEGEGDGSADSVHGSGGWSWSDGIEKF